MDHFKAVISILPVGAVPEEIEELPVNEEKKATGATAQCVIA